MCDCDDEHELGEVGEHDPVRESLEPDLPRYRRSTSALRIVRGFRPGHRILADQLANAHDIGGELVAYALLLIVVPASGLQQLVERLGMETSPLGQALFSASSSSRLDRAPAPCERVRCPRR